MSDRGSDRGSDRAIERPSERATEGSFIGHNSGSRNPFDTPTSAAAYFFKTKRSSIFPRFKAIQIRPFFNYANRSKITKSCLITKFAPGRDVNKNDKSFLITKFASGLDISKKTNHIFSHNSTPDKHILSSLKRHLKTPQIISEDINSNPQINQSQSGNSNTEPSNIFIVSGSM